ncbi:class I SAM-dependent methyltransferase [Salinarimonas ramus]|uniref:Methyltransferase domain-containing protein n=1 Tax=Salinarimonas ramus TaxID=690164 RepID=A0A917QET5_9HYPH|nr:class I SAM-dependent methyltransferase [Salinarimonas ramus]GGK47180.1 hypothetical protein GCM10011322_37770 [Salinarimonas ramus]
MSSWTSGYVADLGYTHGFYRELVPELLRFVALAKGTRAPASGAPLTYCELGCGQGFSANLIAAANPHVEVYATDFNPAQIAGAQALAREAGTPNVHFFDHAFAEFLEEPGLPQFDMICLHGIYSWIAAEHRATIVEFVRRKLKPGGLAYVSYNCLPGWSAAAPMRHLMVQHAKSAGGPTTARVEGALGFVERVLGTEAAYFKQNPVAGPRFEKLKGQNRAYLAHEYFNEAWTLLYFSDVAREMGEAKLSYVGSAALLEHIDAINLSDDQQKLMAEIVDPVLRETVRDYMINQQFRRDVFAKGTVSYDSVTYRNAWGDTRFALSTPREDVPMKVNGARGEANLQPESYEPLLAAFASGPKTVRDLVADPTIAALGWARLTQALAVLVGAGHLQPSLPEKGLGERRKRTQAFNRAVCERARGSADLAFLASPVTGGGVTVDRFQQLFLLARADKIDDPAAFAWSVLNGQGQRLVRDGKPIESPEENLAELRTRFEAFEKRLPVLQQLGIA